MKKVLILGKGFLASHIFNELKENYNTTAIDSKNYNLLDFNQCEKMLQDIKPEVVVSAVGKSGGIKDNSDFPFDYWNSSILINSNCWNLFVKYRIAKVVWVIPGCSFPAKNDTNLIKEDRLFEGYPDYAPSFGSLAKLQAVLASRAAFVQHGLNSTIIIPSNAFGPLDHFDSTSHVISALIMKMHNAKINNDKSIKLWGSGDNSRDFVFAPDVAKTIPFFIENNVAWSCNNPCLERVCNISTATPTSIKELSKMIAEVVGYTGEILWSPGLLEGPKSKTFCNQRMTSLGLFCSTPFKEALQITYDWYLEKCKA